jgi:hypothetical protein
LAGGLVVVFIFVSPDRAVVVTREKNALVSEVPRLKTTALGGSRLFEPKVFPTTCASAGPRMIPSGYDCLAGPKPYYSDTV